MCGKPDALRLAARQRCSSAAECQVVQPHINHELQPRRNLLQHLARNRLLAFVEHALCQLCAPAQHARHRPASYFHNVAAVNFYSQHFTPQSQAAAGFAIALAHVALNFLANEIRRALAVAPLKVWNHAFVFGIPNRVAAVARLVLDGDFFGV